MIKRFRQYIKENELIQPRQKVLLTVSGGVDSVVLSKLFELSRFRFGIAHCNFHLRGEESDMDAQFVKKMAEQLKVPFFLADFRTADWAKTHKISIQQAARELRYKWFEDLIKNQKFDLYATAHHFDDQIETFFINLLRGTGVSGLRGIRPKHKNCIRPLLFANRQEIETFALEHGLNYRIDSSNLHTDYLRNSIRHYVLPALIQAKKDFRTGFSNTFFNLTQTEIFLNDKLQQIHDELLIKESGYWKVDLKGLKDHQPLVFVLFEILKGFDFNSKNILMIANAISGISGKTFYSSSHRACLDRDFLFIFPRSDKKINKDTPCFVANDDSEIFEPVRLVFEKKPFTANWQPVTNPDIEQFDWEKLTFPLEIRRPIRGDYFYPLGLGGKKKLSDFFVDLKLTTIEKSDIFVLTSAGNIIWVIGYRADDRFKITPSTKDIFQINLIRS